MADSTVTGESEKVVPEVTESGDMKSVVKEEKKAQDGGDEKEKIKKEATLLFLQGKRSVYIKDYQAAVVALSEACQMFSQVYSEHDDAMADPYFYYGKALLEVGRSESEVLGDQIQEDKNGDDDDDFDDDDDDEDDEEVQEMLAKTNGNSIEDANSASQSNGQAMDVEASGSKTTNEDENDDINDLQLSWEYLELARLIYLKKADTCKETAVKLAETIVCLGENGIESENYAVAIKDLNEALEIQKKHFQEVDRRIAETYYQLGIAYSLSQNYDEAVTNFKLAIEQLNKKISSLETRKQMGDKKTEEEEKDAFYTMDGEIKEIQVVIKEIEEKIKDMLDCKNQVKAELLKQVVAGGNQPGSSTSSCNNTAVSSSIPTTDISHLIKKKRKNDEEEASSEKKTKLD